MQADSAPEANPALESAPDLADIEASPRRRCCLDLQGWIQVLAGIVIGLIALLTSYDHINVPAGAVLHLHQQWGVWCIAASVALVVADAQLATGSRRRAAEDAVRASRDVLQAAQDSARAADEAARERDRAEQRENEADRERNRAAEERERAARRAERQARCDLVQLRHQLEPTPFHTTQARDVIALLEEYGNLF